MEMAKRRPDTAFDERENGIGDDSPEFGLGDWLGVVRCLVTCGHRPFTEQNSLVAGWFDIGGNGTLRI